MVLTPLSIGDDDFMLLSPFLHICQVHLRNGHFMMDCNSMLTLLDEHWPTTDPYLRLLLSSLQLLMSLLMLCLAWISKLLVGVLRHTSATPHARLLLLAAITGQWWECKAQSESSVNISLMVFLSSSLCPLKIWFWFTAFLLLSPLGMIWALWWGWSYAVHFLVLSPYSILLVMVFAGSIWVSKFSC